MSQTLSSFTFNKILNHEYEVIPLGKSNAAIQKEATDGTILPSAQ